MDYLDIEIALANATIYLNEEKNLGNGNGHRARDSSNGENTESPTQNDKLVQPSREDRKCSPFAKIHEGLVRVRFFSVDIELFHYFAIVDTQDGKYNYFFKN